MPVTLASSTVGLRHIAVLAVSYFIAAKLGFELGMVHTNVTTIWPASGIALAAVLLYGYRILPGVLLGDLLASLSTGMPLTISIVLAVGDTLEIMLGVWLLQQLRGFNSTLQGVASVLGVIVIAAIVSPAIAASIGSSALIFGGLMPVDQFRAIWTSWWAGDAMGIVIFAPLLLAWRTFRWAGTPLRERAEFLVTMAIIVALTLLVEPGHIVDGQGYPLIYLVFPPVLWMAFRFGVWETAAAILMLASITLWQVVEISQDLAATESLTHVYFLHAFLATLALTALPLAALSRERFRVARDLRDSKEHMQLALQSANAGAWQWQIGSEQTHWSREAFLLLGLDPDRDMATVKNWLNCVHPDDRAIALAELSEATDSFSDINIEFRILHPDGEVRWISSIGRMVSNIRGSSAEMHGIMMDITARKQIEAALHDEKERAQITLTSIADAVITTDSDSRIVQINAMAEQLTGWSDAEARGLYIGQVFRLVGEDINTAPFTPTCEEMVSSKSVGQYRNMQLLSMNGQVYDIEVSVAPIRHDSSKILGCVLVFHDATEKLRLQNQIAWQAGHDVLTGLPNRALLSDRLHQAQAHAGRHNQLLGVCFLDLDNFKPVNDEYGHEYGDQILIEVARRLHNTLRGGDTVARLGGDEFVLLITDINDMDGLEEMLDRILKILAEPYVIDMMRISLTASIGVTIYPMDDADADTLLRRADQAMYTSKQTGRNMFHLFDAEQNREDNSRYLQHNRVRQALTQNELRVYYQPQVNMRTGNIIGMEALIRWQHPERGLIGPMEFLPLAEQTSLIIDIGEWVLRQATQQIITWSRAGLQLSVSVNIAARQLQLPDFVERLRALMEAHPELPPHSLQLEILESAALVDIQQVRTVINNCHALGVSFALDDFGTGYSSLTYLKQLPAKTLKIDRSFVRDMLDDDEDLALIEGVIGLAGAFQRKIIAEGVESAEQGVLLMRLGCDLAQGYVIARPMPAQDVAGWVDAYQPDPQWNLWADSHWEMADFPLLVAQYDHTRWVSRVLQAMDGGPLQLSHEELQNHRHCRFGQWYENGGGQRYGHLEEFIEIEPIHERMHAVGPEIIRLFKSGRIDLARTLIPELLDLKDQILERLVTLQQAVSQLARSNKRGPGDNLLLFKVRPKLKK